jgi:hypothetical protein
MRSKALQRAKGRFRIARTTECQLLGNLTTEPERELLAGLRRSSNQRFRPVPAFREDAKRPVEAS